MLHWNCAQCLTFKLPRIISLRCSFYLFDVFVVITHYFVLYFSFKLRIRNCTIWGFFISTLSPLFQCVLHVAFVHAQCLMLDERYIHKYLFMQQKNHIASHTNAEFAAQNESNFVFAYLMLSQEGWREKKSRNTPPTLHIKKNERTNEDKYAKRWNSH